MLMSSRLPLGWTEVRSKTMTINGWERLSYGSTPQYLIFFVFPHPVTQMNQHIPVPDQDAGLVPGPNTLVWEEDMQMCSNFLDRKVNSNLFI